MGDVGRKAVTESCRVAARPSGTGDVDKLGAESFTGSDDPPRLQDETQAIIRRPLRAGAPS